MVTIDHDALIAFTRELVRVDSVHRPDVGGSEARAAALVADRMRAFGWHPVVEQVEPGRPNVIARVDGGRPGPTLLFEGHTDVVTEGDRAEWSYDPFGGEVVDGRLYGRGSADMKGGLAAAMFATAAVAAHGPFPGRIIVAALCDEEGMMAGVKDFVARGHADGVDAAIVCEPEASELCLAQKGAIRVRIDATGRMAHGAMPDHGRNPIPALAGFAAELADIERELVASDGGHPLLGRPSLTPTVLLAGERSQVNVIPARGSMSVDIRTVPGIDHDALIDRLRSSVRTIAEATGIGLELVVLDDRPPTETSADHPVARAMSDAHTAVAGIAPVIGGVPGTTDGTILSRDAHVPVVVYGPGGKWIAHQADEFVELSELTQAAEVYAGAAQRFLDG